jgi:hypothetical protein
MGRQGLKEVGSQESEDRSKKRNVKNNFLNFKKINCSNEVFSDFRLRTSSQLGSFIQIKQN